MVSSHPDNNEISDDEFLRIRNFLESSCGIKLGLNKKYMVKSRLEKLLKESNLSSYMDLINRAYGNRGLIDEIIDRMTTNETLWFRDGHPFVILEEMILPSLLREKAGKVRIWSSAAATGQEPYSIAMVILDFCKKNPAIAPDRFEILATDISRTALETARRGIYDAFEISRGLPGRYQREYFRREDNRWTVSESLKSMVEFREFNLQMPFGWRVLFDVVFCRNVMIYFPAAFKKELMRKFGNVLHDEGYFLLGTSETMLGTSSIFRSEIHKGGVVYRKSTAGRHAREKEFPAHPPARVETA